MLPVQPFVGCSIPYQTLWSWYRTKHPDGKEITDVQSVFETAFPGFTLMVYASKMAQTPDNCLYFAALKNSAKKNSQDEACAAKFDDIRRAFEPWTKELEVVNYLFDEELDSDPEET